MIASILPFCLCIPGLTACVTARLFQIPNPGARTEAVITGQLKAGESFKQSFGPNFVFELSPARHASGVWMGWHLAIRQRNSGVNLAGMTLPWRGPGPLIIYGWNFLPGANAPHKIREFMFSPEVEDSITWEMVDPRDQPKDYERTKTLLSRIERFGRGVLRITRYELTPAAEDSQVGLKWIEFELRISWPVVYKAR